MYSIKHLSMSDSNFLFRHLIFKVDARKSISGFSVNDCELKGLEFALRNHQFI
jgi:hypothetical protein